MTFRQRHSYQLTTHWHLPTTLPAAWDAIRQSEQWPLWWPSVRRVVELAPGDADGIGNRRHYVWRGFLPYTLSFDIEVIKVEKYAFIEGVARGELDGVGRWVFFEAQGETRVRHDWNVATTSRWINLLAPIAKPLFEWNHRRVMMLGERRLRERLANSAFR